MLRPGRMDAVIEIAELDLEGTTRLIHSQFKTWELSKDLDISVIHEAMKAFTPAFMKEVCQKVKLYSIARIAQGKESAYTTEDFLYATQEMRVHYDLHIGAADLQEVPSMDRAIRDAIQDTLDKSKLLDLYDGNEEKYELHVTN